MSGEMTIGRAGAALVLLALLAGCAQAGSPAESGTAGTEKVSAGPSSGQPTSDAGPQTPSSAAANVQVQEVALGTLVEWVVARGDTIARHDVTYSAEVPGKVDFLGPELGDRVKKGQVLARIDTATLSAQLQQAKAAASLAESTLARLEKLDADNLVPQQQLDEARSRVVSARAQLAIARTQLAKSTVKASRAGIVVTKAVDRAEYVAPGMPLYQVVDYSEIVVEAQVPETQVAAIVPGAAAAVTVGGLSREFEGRVETVVPTADRVSKTFTMRVVVDNPELEILVGMSATIEVRVRAHEEAVVVSRNAVVEGEDGRSVFVEAGGKAERRAVELGPSEGERVLVASGLGVGDRLIVVGQRNLVDGQPVTVIR